MKKIYIVGGNGFARECYLTLSKLIQYNSDINFGGFLGHGGYGKTVDYKQLQKYYIGEVSDKNFSEDEFVIIGAGYPELRHKIYNELKSRKINFYNLISPIIKINDYVEIGEANVIMAPFTIGPDVKIGDGNVFNGDVVVGHDAVVGNFNFIGGKSQILGNTRIGNDNTIGSACVFLPNSKIGNNNKIAPISAVYKGCKDNCYMLGNPALIIK